MREYAVVWVLGAGAPVVETEKSEETDSGKGAAGSCAQKLVSKCQRRSCEGARLAAGEVRCCHTDAESESLGREWERSMWPLLPLSSASVRMSCSLRPRARAKVRHSRHTRGFSTSTAKLASCKRAPENKRLVIELYKKNSGYNTGLTFKFLFKKDLKMLYK